MPDTACSAARATSPVALLSTSSCPYCKAILLVDLTMSRHSRVGSGSSQPLEYEPLLASDNAIPKSRVAVDVQEVGFADVDDEETLGERFAAVRAGEGSLPEDVLSS